MKSKPLIAFTLLLLTPLAAHAQQTTATVRDHLWMFGLPPGSDLGCFEGGGIRGGSRMTPVEACFWMGVPNLLFITQAGNPPDTYAERRGNWKTNNPYVIADLPKPALSLCTFSDATGSITAAVEVLFGRPHRSHSDGETSYTRQCGQAHRQVEERTSATRRVSQSRRENHPTPQNNHSLKTMNTRILSFLAIISTCSLTFAATESATPTLDVNQRRAIGDGVADDTAAIQALLDSRRALVHLPAPSKHYLISKPLRIYSNQTLQLDRFAVIRLKDGSDCLMITNDDHERGNENVALVGGVWDMHNEGQSLCEYQKTRIWKGTYDPASYLGVLMRFNRVKRLTLRGLTLKDPVTFSTQLGNLTEFTIEDMTFDHNLKRTNMDGIHIHGNSRHGRITNLKGATNDDLIALNADDGGIYEMSRGPIEDVAVDGIWATDGYTAVRLLSAGSPIRRVRLANSDRDTLQVSLRDAKGRELWHKTIRTMLLRASPKLPAFGAIETKLRYDYPLLSYSGPDEVTEIPYEKAWAPERKDVVVALPNGSRFVFWRGAAYTPFWAGKNNTGLNFEFAEAPRRPDGLDCIDAASDKELRRSRVEIIESTAARIHVRWTAQPCDLNYKVWGETATEDFYFYPDGFGSRTVTLQTEPKAQYEIEELLILTPPAGYPLRVLPENLVDVLFRDGSKRELKYPFLDLEPDYEKLMSGERPPLYRIRFGARELLSAIYFNPGWTRLPVLALRPFYSQGQMVTPFYWGNHLPLARRKPTGHNIDERAFMTPAHNAMMSWGHRRPQPLESRVADMPDALGVTRPMKVEKWAWLIGLSDADDARLLEWSRSFATPPKVEAEGAKLQSPAYNTERRATLLTVEKPIVSLTIKPTTPCVHPGFELQGAPKMLSRVELGSRVLAANDYAWDGRTLWLNITLRDEATLRLTFSD